jgi:PHD/YefM family antitoxin component YafN of YafNO toxin-antitoxin module
MAQLPEIIPVTDLRQDGAVVLKRLQTSEEPLVITQRERPATIVLSVDAYGRSKGERQLLRVLVQVSKKLPPVWGTTWTSGWPKQTPSSRTRARESPLCPNAPCVISCGDHRHSSGEPQSGSPLPPTGGGGVTPP